MAEGSVGDLTAGGKIEIHNDIMANGIGNISAGTDLELRSAIVLSTDDVSTVSVEVTHDEETDTVHLFRMQMQTNQSEIFPLEMG